MEQLTTGRISLRRTGTYAGAPVAGFVTALHNEEGRDLGELAHLIIAHRGDTLDDIEREAGVPLATNLVDGSSLGERGFTHNFELIERHLGGWIEAVLILSDDGFAVALFVPDLITTDPRLFKLLRS